MPDWKCNRDSGRDEGAKVMIEFIIYTIVIAVIFYSFGKYRADKFWYRMDSLKEQEIKELMDLISERAEY